MLGTERGVRLATPIGFHGDGQQFDFELFLFRFSANGAQILVETFLSSLMALIAASRSLRLISSSAFSLFNVTLRRWSSSAQTGQCRGIGRFVVAIFVHGAIVVKAQSIVDTIAFAIDLRLRAAHLARYRHAHGLAVLCDVIVVVDHFVFVDQDGTRRRQGRRRWSLGTGMAGVGWFNLILIRLISPASLRASCVF